MIDQEIKDLEHDIAILKSQIKEYRETDVLHMKDDIKLRPYVILSEQLEDAQCRLYELLRIKRRDKNANQS